MQKIIVKNFGPIKEATIELKGLTILIGEQASGKSTIAKLIYFFKTLKKDLYDLAIYESEILNNPTDVNEIISKAIENIKVKFRKYFGNPVKLHHNYSIAFQFSENNAITLSGIPQNISFAPDNFFREIFKTLIISAPAIVRLQQNNEFKGLELYQTKLSEQLNNLFQDNFDPLFIPAGRNITVSYPQEFKDFFLSGKSLTNTLPQKKYDQKTIERDLMQGFLGRVAVIQDRFSNSNFNQIFEQEMIFDEDTIQRSKRAMSIVRLVLKGEYSNVGGQSEGIKPIGGKSVIPIYESSSGQQEALRILQDIYLCLLDEKSVFRVIEEPEAHLFPRAQGQIMQLLSLLMGNGEHQLLITTHSPYILSILNNLLFAWQVTDKYPNAQIDIEPEFRINPSKFTAYSLRNGTCESIFDIETGLIDHNYLDEIFEEIGLEYRSIYEVYADLITSNNMI